MEKSEPLNTYNKVHLNTEGEKWSAFEALHSLDVVKQFGYSGTYERAGIKVSAYKHFISRIWVYIGDDGNYYEPQAIELDKIKDTESHYRVIDKQYGHERVEFACDNEIHH